MDEIYDGLEQTILMAENINAGSFGFWSHPEPANCGFFFPVEYDSAVGSNFAVPVNTAGLDPRPNASKNLGEGTPTASSDHAGLVNVVMASGSARSISDDIDAVVYSYLITPSGTKQRQAIERTCSDMETGGLLPPQAILGDDF